MRNRSRQRDLILAWLRASKSHPTAAGIYEGVRDELPNLSLATVYRNLDLLEQEGRLRTLHAARAGGPGGGTRYDGNTEPHHHFYCDGCGAIVDIVIPEPRGLTNRLSREHGFVANRVSIDFHGFCEGCQSADEQSHP